MLHRIHPAQAGMLDLGHFAVAGEWRPALGFERVVEHAFDDDGAGGVVRARLGSQTEEADARGIDGITSHGPQARRPRDRVYTLRRPAHPEATADDGLSLVPGRARPIAPGFEINAVGRHIDRESTDADWLAHKESPTIPLTPSALPRVRCA